MLSPPAFVRLPRTAGVRRALLVVVFLGGFLFLAGVIAGHAHAEGRAGSGNGALDLVKGRGSHAAAVRGGLSTVADGVRETAHKARRHGERELTHTARVSDEGAREAVEYTGADEVSADLARTVRAVLLPGGLPGAPGGQGSTGSAGAHEHHGARPGGDRPAEHLAAGASFGPHGHAPGDHRQGAARPGTADEGPFPPLSLCERVSCVGTFNQRSSGDSHAAVPASAVDVPVTVSASRTARAAELLPDRAGDILELPG